MWKLIGFAIYLGIGALCYALMVGPTFDWSSPWTFVWLFGWPFILVAAGWGFLIVAFIVVAVCGAWLPILADGWHRLKGGKAGARRTHP